METIQLENGKTAISFIADDNSPLAIVHLSVIQRLTRLLRKKNFSEIQGDIIDRITLSLNLKDLIEIMHDEVAFHQSVNLIQEYSVPKEESTPIDHADICQ